MNSKESCGCLLVVLLKVQRKYKKSYCWPSQAKILKLLGDNQGIHKSRATLNRRLRAGEDDKLFIRRRRIKVDPIYGMMFKSTLYKISIKGYRVLASLGVAVGNEIDAYKRWIDSIKSEHGKSIWNDTVRKNRKVELHSMAGGLADALGFK